MMKDNKRIIVQALVAALATIAVVWELMGFITGHRSAESPKQFLSTVFLCWLVFTLFRNQQDDDDWAGQY
jgi:hypothetical protein